MSTPWIWKPNNADVRRWTAAIDLDAVVAFWLEERNMHPLLQLNVLVSASRFGEPQKISFDANGNLTPGWMLCEALKAHWELKMKGTA